MFVSGNFSLTIHPKKYTIEQIEVSGSSTSDSDDMPGLEMVPVMDLNHETEDNSDSEISDDMMACMVACDEFIKTHCKKNDDMIQKITMNSIYGHYGGKFDSMDHTVSHFIPHSTEDWETILSAERPRYMYSGLFEKKSYDWSKNDYGLPDPALQIGVSVSATSGCSGTFDGDTIHDYVPDLVPDPMPSQLTSQINHFEEKPDDSEYFTILGCEKIKNNEMPRAIFQYHNSKQPMGMYARLKQQEKESEIKQEKESEIKQVIDIIDKEIILKIEI